VNLGGVFAELKWRNVKFDLTTSIVRFKNASKKRLSGKASFLEKQSDSLNSTFQ
jgi:hypothetical protein